MAAELSDDERLIRDWLCHRGYAEPEYEPAVVTNGRRPDFLATAQSEGVAPNLLWAEVKSLEPSKSTIALSKSWPILKQLGVPEKVNGYAMLHVTETTREQSVRALVKMFYGKAIKHASENVGLVFVQHCSAKTDVRYVEVQGEIVQKVWARGAGDGKIAVPSGAIENPSAMATWEQDGQLKTQPAFSIFDWLLPIDCGVIARIDPKSQPLTSISSMAGGSSNITARALTALEDANSQLRNACNFKAAPGIVFIVPTEDHADDEMIAMAAYGELTLSISRETGKLGEAFYGLNGAFRPDKNTHISAAIRLRRKGGAATYFPNPFAKLPIHESDTLFHGLRRAAVKF